MIGKPHTRNTATHRLAAGEPSGYDDLSSRLKWIILMRLILVTILLGVTVVLRLRDSSTGGISSFIFLYSLIGYSYALTAISALAAKYMKRPVFLSYLQIIGDLIFITGILHITGGIDSPFVFLYFFSIITGSILRYQKGSLIAASLSACSYLALVYLNTAGDFPLHSGTGISYTSAELYYRTFLNLFSFVIIAFLSSQLAGRLKMAGEEIRQKADSIEDLELLNENVIQSVTSGLITTDLHGKITSVNMAAEKILRIPRNEILEAKLDALFPYPEVREYLELKRIDDANEKYSRLEVEYGSIENLAVTLGMTLTPLRNRTGGLTGSLCTFQDLTQIKALEEKMRRHEQLAAIGELAAGMAHEIRNPLASMSGSIQVLQAELDLNRDNRRLMDIILKETDRLNTLIGNFLMYARPRPLDCRPQRLRELLEETFLLLKNNHRVHQAIEIKMDVDSDSAVMADSMAIRQVLWNLATNAIDAMPDGGTLTIETRDMEWGETSQWGKVPGQGGMVRVTLTDTGKGISPEISKTIFFPFRTNKAGGTGLGLAIVHQIIEQHGGWIDVVSSPGEGTAVHLYLPKPVELLLHQEV